MLLRIIGNGGALGLTVHGEHRGVKIDGHRVRGNQECGAQRVVNLDQRLEILLAPAVQKAADR